VAVTRGGGVEKGRVRTPLQSWHFKYFMTSTLFGNWRQTEKGKKRERDGECMGDRDGYSISCGQQ